MPACNYLAKLFCFLLSLFFVGSAAAFTCTEPTNVALASNGATATASSSFSGWGPSGAINGERRGLFVWQNGVWSAAAAGLPAWLEVQFNGSKTISEIDVVALQDNYNAPIEPNETHDLHTLWVIELSGEVLDRISVGNDSRRQYCGQQQDLA